MTAEEQKALQDGMNEAKREHFNGEVMRVLADGHDDRLGRATSQSYPYEAGLSGTMLGTTSNTLKEYVRETLDKQFEEAYARQDTKTIKVTKKLKEAMRK